MQMRDEQCDSVTALDRETRSAVEAEAPPPPPHRRGAFEPRPPSISPRDFIRRRVAFETFMNFMGDIVPSLIGRKSVEIGRAFKSRSGLIEVEYST